MVKSVPPNSIVVGVPGQVVVRSRPRARPSTPDLEHTALPDTIGEALVTLMQRVNGIEERLDGHEERMPSLHAPDHGVWRGEDFSI